MEWSGKDRKNLIRVSIYVSIIVVELRDTEKSNQSGDNGYGDWEQIQELFWVYSVDNNWLAVGTKEGESVFFATLISFLYIITLNMTCLIEVN